MRYKKGYNMFQFEQNIHKYGKLLWAGIIIFAIIIFFPINSQAAAKESKLISGKDFMEAAQHLRSPYSHWSVSQLIYEDSPADDILNMNTYVVISETGPEIRMCYTPNDQIIHIYAIEPVDVIFLNQDCSQMFGSGFSDCTYIDTHWFDTRYVTNMSSMFENCDSLSSLDLTNFDTSNVTNMSKMFDSCCNIEPSGLENFDVSNVTDMSMMFAHTYAMSFDFLQDWDTSSVTNMSGMFYAVALESDRTLDLTGLDTTNVTNMSGMFELNFELTNLDISGFDTRHVTDMSFMFDSCHRLTNINLSHFDTSCVTDMTGMFNACDSLETLDLQTFDTSKVVNMGGMFNNCFSLRQIYFGETFTTEECLSMDSMFHNDAELKSLDLHTFTTDHIKSMRGMFENCTNLHELDLSTFHINSGTQLFYTLADAAVNKGNASSWGISDDDRKDPTQHYMLLGCTALTKLIAPSFIADDISIPFPTASGQWFLDMNNDGFPDSDEMYTSLQTGNVQYIYIQYTVKASDLNNPNSIAIPVTMDVVSSYEVSVPAALLFTQDPIYMTINAIEDITIDGDASIDAWTSFKMIDDTHGQQVIDTANTFYCAGAIEISGTGYSDVKVNITPPVMSNGNTAIETKLFPIDEWTNSTALYKMFGGVLDDDLHNSNKNFFIERSTNLQHYCEMNGFYNPLSRHYYHFTTAYDYIDEDGNISGVSRDEIKAEEVRKFTQYKDSFVQDDGEMHITTPLILSSAFTPANSYRGNIGIWGDAESYSLPFILAADFNNNGVYTGNISIDFALDASDYWPYGLISVYYKTSYLESNP